MLATIFTGTTRYRRQILAVTVVLAVGLLWLCPRPVPPGSLLLVVLASPVLAMLAFLWPRPPALTVDPRRRAFHALPSAGWVYLFVGMAFVVAMEIGIDGDLRPSTDTDRGLDQFGTVPLTVTVLAVGLILVLAWRGSGVELRPDGLIDYTPFGTLTVPWEALAPGYPQPGPGRSIVLAYARPELLRRRHIVFSRRRLAAQNLNVDLQFLGAVIAYYVAYPQYRPAIGTLAEYDRLLHVTSRSASA